MPLLLIAGLLAASAQAGVEPVGNDSTASTGSTNERIPERAAGGFTPADNEFLFGNSFTQYGTNCFTGATEQMVTSYAGYTPGRAKVGQRWWGRIEMYMTGNQCGGEFVSPVVRIPDDTGFAINGDFPFKCEVINLGGSSQWIDVTNTTAQDPATGSNYQPCASNQTSSGHVLYQGFGFRITFPMVSTAQLRGASVSPPDVIQATVNTANAFGTGEPYQFLNVGPAPTPEVQYPNPSTDQISSNSAHSSGIVYTYNRAGTMYVEIGKTTDYGTIGASYPASRNEVGYQIDQDWRGLKPSTTYHWRLRFVDSAGQAYRGADQTFTTAGAPPSNVTKPKISGTPRKGQKLTAKPGEWEGTAPIAFVYEWQRCDSTGAACVPIAGATARTYKLTSSEVGKRLRVAVGASNSRGQSSATSAATARIKR